MRFFSFLFFPFPFQGSAGARELSGLAIRLLAALLTDLKSGVHVGRSTASEEGKRGAAPSAEDEARSAVARLAFQVGIGFLCFIYRVLLSTLRVIIDQSLHCGC